MSSKPKMGRRLLVADETWVGLALLHREHPEKTSFTAREILDRVKTEHAAPELRPGVQVHIYLHNVANIEPNSAQYRMFYRLPDDTYRLLRSLDQSHPSRRGKTKPNRAELPERYHPLLDWYEAEYAGKEAVLGEEDDPVLQMRGVGKEIWADMDADDYVRSLRANWCGDERRDR